MSKPGIGVTTYASIPRFSQLLMNYPSGSVEYVKTLIGGGVDAPYINDTCAIRMSRALNYSGIAIPANAAGLYTVSGKDKKHYALRMQELKNWIQFHFGPPQITATRPVDRNGFVGSKGIIAFDITFGLNPDGRNRALGHLDLWDGNSYTHQAEDSRDYFALATKVVLWEAPG